MPIPDFESSPSETTLPMPSQASTIENEASSKDHSLLPCPFCGNENPSDDFLYMTCDVCGAYGPDPKDGMTAAELWNQRRVVRREVRRG